jgi:hypothetical protein
MRVIDSGIQHRGNIGEGTIHTEQVKTMQLREECLRSIEMGSWMPLGIQTQYHCKDSTQART